MTRRVILIVSILGVILLIRAGVSYYNLFEAKVVHVKSVWLKNEGNEARISDCQLFDYIDSYFKEWKLDNTVANGGTEADVYEFKNSATSKQAFKSISDNLDALCSSQNQIIAFCKEYKDELASSPWATLFLLKGDGTYYVAIVGNFHDGLRIYLRSFDSEKVFEGWDHNRVNRLVVSN